VHRILPLVAFALLLSAQAAQLDQSRAALQPRNADERAIASHFSNFFKGYKPLQPGANTGFPSEPPPPPSEPRKTNEFDEFRAAVCRTDLIATGRMTASRVMFNAGETFLVTLYEFRIDTWLRASTPPPRTVQVALAGGETVLEGRKTLVQILPLYPLDGLVTMWLKQIPGSSVYRITEVGILTFEDDQPRMHYHQWIRLLQGSENQANVLTAIVNAAATCSGRKF
jgi:hypothetical protein